MYTQRPNIAPIDLELNYDGNTYYVVASALPMREKNFKKSMQKEALLFMLHFDFLCLSAPGTARFLI